MKHVPVNRFLMVLSMNCIILKVSVHTRRYKKDNRSTIRFKECITMKKLTTMNSDCLSIKLRKWGKLEEMESDGKYRVEIIRF